MDAERSAVNSYEAVLKVLDTVTDLLAQAGFRDDSSVRQQLAIAKSMLRDLPTGPKWEETTPKYATPLAWESNATGKIYVAVNVGDRSYQIELDRPTATQQRTLAEAMPDTNADGSYTYRPKK
jgi:hypothetical protein